jgi:hypothetical protein
MRTFDQYLVERHDGDGDCMEAAANFMMACHSNYFGEQEKGMKDAVLVHALVYGQGMVAGLRFPHAWVESGDRVIDRSNGRDIRMEKKVYYALGGIKPNEKGTYFKYNYQQMKRKLIGTGHYGPWDLDERLEESILIGNKRMIGKRKKRVNPSILSALKEDLEEGIVTGRPTTGRYAYAGGGAWARDQEPHEKVTWNDLKRLESVLDSMFSAAKLDISFTRHFWERINGSRGYGGTVTIPELQDAFRKTYAKYAQKIKDHPADWKAIILDVSKNLNMPFTLDWDGKKKSMIMVTAMKKPNFMSPDPKLPV